MNALHNLILGIIPANTGRILIHGSTLRGTWDHPREYGENLANNVFNPTVEGSSPRIRGECAGSLRSHP